MRVAILTVLLIASPALATSYAQPERHDVFSRNGKYVLDVDPKTEVHTVYDARDRTRPLWSFRKPVWHYPFLVSDDGTVVVTVAWKHMQVDDAEKVGVEFWNKDGVFRSYPLAELCPNPAKTQDVGVGPIGDFWRTWYTEVKDHGDAFSLRTTSGIELRFRYSDGEMIKRRRVGLPVWGGWMWLGAGLILAASITVGFLRLRLRRGEVSPPRRPR